MSAYVCGTALSNEGRCGSEIGYELGCSAVTLTGDLVCSSGGYYTNPPFYAVLALESEMPRALHHVVVVDNHGNAVFGKG